MATVFKKTFTKAVPEGADTFTRKGQRFARWKDGKGKTRTAKLTTGADGTARLLIEAATFTAKLRDGAGIVREVATGCRDETAARAVLAELVRRAELVKGGVVNGAEDAAIDHQGTPLTAHVDAYVAHLTAKGGAPGRIAQVKARLLRVFGDCRFARLADLSGEAVERWLAERKKEDLSAAGRNNYREAAVGFGNWARRTHRLIANPFADLPLANAKADPRRPRRALTEDELARLLAVAQRRPLADARTVRTGKRRGQATAKLTERNAARLVRLGRERALIYGSSEEFVGRLTGRAGGQKLIRR